MSSNTTIFVGSFFISCCVVLSFLAAYHTGSVKEASLLWRDGVNGTLSSHDERISDLLLKQYGDELLLGRTAVEARESLLTARNASAMAEALSPVVVGNCYAILPNESFFSMNCVVGGTHE